jgi:hypothetical protein
LTSPEFAQPTVFVISGNAFQKILPAGAAFSGENLPYRSFLIDRWFNLGYVKIGHSP